MLSYKDMLPVLGVRRHSLHLLAYVLAASKDVIIFWGLQ